MTDKDVLFITDKNGHKTHAIVPISVYESLVSLKGIIQNTAKTSKYELYTYQVKNVTATGYPTGMRTKPHFVIIQGSQCVLINANTLPENISALKEELINSRVIELDIEHNCFTFKKDYEFKSATQAASLVAGTLRAGLSVFTNREGFSLKDSGYGSKKKLKRKI